MRRLRLQCTILIILACLSIISVGFASWVTTTDSISTTIDGTIIVDDVATNTEYLSSNLIPFNYYKTKFVDEENNLTDTGTMTAILTLTEKGMNLFKNDSSMEIQLNLYCKYLSLLNDSTNILMNVSAELITGDSSLLSITSKSYNDTDYNLVLNIQNINTLAEISIKVYYVFTINNQTNTIRGYQYFYNNVYPKLINNELTFKLGTKFTGK